VERESSQTRQKVGLELYDECNKADEASCKAEAASEHESSRLVLRWLEVERAVMWNRVLYF
jgi:hypothetical protein